MFQPKETDLTADGSEQLALHDRAAATTWARFGKKVFVRGVVEVSNFCRENCCYCGMRRANEAIDRYRANLDTLAEALVHQRPASITEVNIQGGEDPVAVREVVLPLIRILRRETPLGIICCLGTLDGALYGELQDAGATIYIMKFEVSNPALYAAMQAPGTLEERLRHIRKLAEAGWYVSSGFIAGLPGQDGGEILESLRLAKELPLVGCSVSPFVAGSQTPLRDAPTLDANRTLNCMAAMRLMRPDWIIPAVSALNIASADGYRRGLRAGANLVTMNLTPPEVRGDYVIYRRDRFIMTEARILAALEAEGLEPSPVGLADFLEQQTRPLTGSLQQA